MKNAVGQTGLASEGGDRPAAPYAEKEQRGYVSKRRGGPLLRQAVKAVRNANPDLSGDEIRALERLSADRRAQKAYDFLANQAAAETLVWAYIQALEIRRTFDAEIAQSRRFLGNSKRRGELDCLIGGLVAVERFFENLQKQPLGWIASQSRVPARTLGQLFGALTLAKDLLEDQRRIAKETPTRLGAAQKVGRGAADLAAIGWLAQEVRHCTGKANRELVQLLAEVVLQRGVTEFRVRKAERIRLGREWRLPPRTEDGGRSPYAGELMSSRRTDLRRRTAAEARQGRLVGTITR